MEAKERFQDTPKGWVEDRKHHKAWLPKDSYGDLGVWRNWHEAQMYARTMNQVYPGGHADWRFPTREEALQLYDEQLMQMDCEEQHVHIHPLFVKQCAPYMWTSEVNDQDEALRINLRDGALEFVDKTTREQHAVRLMRDLKK